MSYSKYTISSSAYEGLHQLQNDCVLTLRRASISHKQPYKSYFRVNGCHIRFDTHTIFIFTKLNRGHKCAVSVGAIIHVAVCFIDGVTVLLKLVPFSCSFRYEDAVSKFEAVMKTEPNVHHFSLLAKQRICHALTQVRLLSADLVLHLVIH